jgi:aminoglycoside 3-N-acetyltransferase
MNNGVREWKMVKDIKSITDDFDRIGEAFLKEKKDAVRISNIGMAKSQLLSQRDIVDFAVKWMEANRK